MSLYQNNKKVTRYSNQLKTFDLTFAFDVPRQLGHSDKNKG